MEQPTDRNGKQLSIGARVRLLHLSGNWLDELPPEEAKDVNSMIGEVFEIEEIDEYGKAWISKSWPDETEGTCNSHSIALDPHEIELVEEAE